MSDTEISASDLAGTEYQPNETFIALMSNQGNVTHYNIVLPMQAILHSVKKPDPNVTLPTNRKVDKGRATAFGKEYLFERARKGTWICPPLTLRLKTNDIVSVTHISDDGRVVRIEVPKLRLWDIHDGQHRALGTHAFKEELQGLIDDFQDQADKARINSDKQLENWNLKQAEEHRKILGDVLDRSTVLLTLVVAPSKVQNQLFSDMAIHAKGISPDFAFYMDHLDPLSNIAKRVIEELEYLEGLVSYGQKGRVAKKDPELIGLKSLRDIARAVSVGGSGRVGKKIHDSLLKDERAWADRTRVFMDTCFMSFSGLRDLVEGNTTAAQVKAASLIGSATMLRVLAAVWHEALIEPTAPHTKATVAETQNFFKALDPHMACFEEVERTSPDGTIKTVTGVPESKQLWMDTLKFRPGTTAPTARPADIGDLAQEITRWMREGNDELGWEGLPKA